MNYLPLGSTTFTEMPESQDGTAIRALQSIGLLKDARVLEVSDMVGDQSQLHRSQVVNEIRRNAEKPGVCVIVDFDEILDGFYDLLNLRFQRIQLEDRAAFAATIAAGSYSVLAPVHPHFQLVVCIKAADLPSTPLPFLNRFEKFYCSPADLAVRTASQLCGGQISRDVLKNFLVGAAGDRLHDLVQLLGPASLVGYQPATLGSAINEALPGAAEALEALAAAWHGREEQRAALEMRPLPPRLAEALASHRRKPKAGVHPRNM